MVGIPTERPGAITDLLPRLFGGFLIQRGCPGDCGLVFAAYFSRWGVLRGLNRSRQLPQVSRPLHRLSPLYLLRTRRKRAPCPAVRRMFPRRGLNITCFQDQERSSAGLQAGACRAQSRSADAGTMTKAQAVELKKRLGVHYPRSARGGTVSAFLPGVGRPRHTRYAGDPPLQPDRHLHARADSDDL
jgi:hypothetical protein